MVCVKLFGRATNDADVVATYLFDPHGTVTAGSLNVEALDRLAGDLCDQLEVLIDVKHCEAGELGGCADQQIGNRWGPVFAALGEDRLDLDGAAFDS